MKHIPKSVMWTLAGIIILTMYGHLFMGIGVACMIGGYHYWCHEEKP